MWDGSRHAHPAVPSPRQQSQALARSIEDELLSASVNTPHSTRNSDGRHSTALLRTVVQDEAPQSSHGPVRGPLARAESRETEAVGKASRTTSTTAPAPAPAPAPASGGTAAAWNVSFGGPSVAPGNKRKRKPSPQAAHLRARLEGRTQAAANDANADEQGNGRVTNPPSSVPPSITAVRSGQASGMPTPPAPPPRRAAVLLETPRFIREEREAAAAAAACAGRASGPKESSPGPTGASLLARGMSLLRTTPSVVLPMRESTVRDSQSRARRESRHGPKRRSDGSPWDLSTIPSASARKGQRPPHRNNSGSRWSGDSSSVSSFARTEMLNFLEPSIGPAPPTSTAAARGADAVLSSSSAGRAPSGPHDPHQTVQPFPHRDSRFAALSSISSSLADIVSSSRSSLRSNLAAVPPPRVDGTAAQASGSGSHSSGSGAGAVSDRRHHRTSARSPTIMDPPDVSSIHGEEEEIRRRQHARLARHPHHTAPSDVAFQQHARGGTARTVLQLPARHAVSSSGAHPAARRGAQAGGPSSEGGAHARDSGSGAWRRSRLRTRLASLMRVLFSLALVGLFVLCGLCVVAPLLVDLDRAEDTLMRYYVNPVSELHALYRIAPASLSEVEVRQLYGRALSEGVERLERSTAHLADLVQSSTRADQILYLQQLVRAYVAVQHRARLYARSRDASAWRRLLAYPVADAWRFGLARHGLRYTLRRLLRKPSWRYVVELGRGSMNCLAQSEELPCPTLLFVEQSMMILSAPDPEWADDAESVVRDVNAGLDAALGLRQRPHSQWPTLRRDWYSEVYLETLLTFIRGTIRQSTRDYNH